jgi:hypothetical protein
LTHTTLTLLSLLALAFLAYTAGEYAARLNVWKKLDLEAGLVKVRVVSLIDQAFAARADTVRPSPILGAPHGS